MTDASRSGELQRLVDATLLVEFRGTTAPTWVLGALEEGLAGVTLLAVNGNIGQPAEVAELTRRLRGAANAPIIALSEEGGDVTRLAHRTGSPYPGNAALGFVDDPELTRGVYRSLGADLRAAGVNLDFAPTIDVNTTDDNPIIGTRSFGAVPALVARHAGAAVTGLQEMGVAATAKRFPGHGAASRDSHVELPTVTSDVKQLWHRELVPFRETIARGRAAAEVLGLMPR